MYLLNHIHERPLYHSKVPISRLKDALSKHFRIGIVDETGDSLKCIILRRWRLIGAPWLGPHTRLKIQIIEDSNNFKIEYSFFYPEYIFYWAISLLVATIFVFSVNEPPKVLIQLLVLQHLLFWHQFSVFLYLWTLNSFMTDSKSYQRAFELTS